MDRAGTAGPAVCLPHAPALSTQRPRSYYESTKMRHILPRALHETIHTIDTHLNGTPGSPPSLVVALLCFEMLFSTVGLIVFVCIYWRPFAVLDQLHIPDTIMLCVLSSMLACWS